MFRVSCTIWYQLRRGQKAEGRGWHKTFLATGTFLINLLQQFKQQTSRGGLGHIKNRKTVRWEDSASENNRTTDFDGKFFRNSTLIVGNFIFGLSWDGDHCAMMIFTAWLAVPEWVWVESWHSLFTLYSTYLLKLMLLMALLRSFSSFSTGNNNHFLLNVFFWNWKEYLKFWMSWYIQLYINYLRQTSGLCSILL